MQKINSYILTLAVALILITSNSNSNAKNFLDKHYNFEKQFSREPTDPPLPPVRSIAEWEPMEGVMIRYPFGIPCDFIALMSQEINVYIIVNGQIEQDYITTEFINSSVNMENCIFIHALANSYWTRDYGPLYIMTGDNNIAGVDYSYRFQNHNFSDLIPVHITNFLGLSYYKIPNFIFDGTSNFMTDGMGVATSSSYVLTINPEISQTEIEEKLNSYLGINNYHIIQQSPNGHHIDTWAKFLAPDKILIHEVPDHHPAYNDYENAALHFQSAISSYNRPYKVFRVPTPNDEPYANSLILNDRIFVPITGNHENDSIALQIYENVMPGYQIYGVYYEGFTSGDAVHCRTQEVPDREMLHIFHIPLPENVLQEDDFLVQAKIIPFSEEELYEDSIKVHFKINDGEFQSIIMTHDYDDYYSATIPQQDIDSEISYYISAADYSGRSAKHPFIGQYDPHIFNVVSPLYISDFNIDESINDESNQIFSIYPNPAKDILVISSNVKIFELSIISIMGESLVQHFVNDYELIIDIGDILPGFYLINISTYDSGILTKGFIKID